MKKNSENKVDWAVSAYIDWHNERLEKFQYDPAIYFADLLNLESLEKCNLNHALCWFIPEVTKKRGSGPYPGATLYQMIVAIQKYLVINKLKWKLIEGEEFDDMRTVLDNIMQECTAANIGVVKRQAGIISYEHENSLWSKGILGEDTPDTLRSTVLFLLGINCCLRAVHEHYNLHRDVDDMKGQLMFVLNPGGVRCILYRGDAVTKTHDGGLGDMNRDRKSCWIYPNLGNPSRCPVRLIEKYFNLCPKVSKKPNFYLQSLNKPTPSQWYSAQVVGQHMISKVVKSLMEKAGIKGFFTNHSTRRTGGTRLFRAGVQCKLVKETTGHRSDAVDKYQITSDAQRQMISELIAGEHEHKIREMSDVNFNAEPKLKATECVQMASECQNCKINAGNVGSIVDDLIKKQSGGGKTIIKIQIEICKE